MATILNIKKESLWKQRKQLRNENVEKRVNIMAKRHLKDTRLGLVIATPIAARTQSFIKNDSKYTIKENILCLELVASLDIPTWIKWRISDRECDWTYRVIRVRYFCTLSKTGRTGLKIARWTSLGKLFFQRNQVCLQTHSRPRFRSITTP